MVKSQDKNYSMLNKTKAADFSAASIHEHMKLTVVTSVNYDIGRDLCLEAGQSGLLQYR